MPRESVELRSAAELEAMREAGRAVAAALNTVTTRITRSATGVELETTARAALAEHDARPAFGGARQSASCGRALAVSRQQVVGGRAPDGTGFAPGELVTVECAASVDGWCAWSAVTETVDAEDEPARRSAGTAREALRGAASAATAGNRLGDLSHALGLVVRGAGYGMPASCGHGIGRALREPPALPPPGKRGEGLLLRPGTVVTIVAALAEGGSDGIRHGPGGAVETEDGSRCFLLGETLAVTAQGPWILTVP
ncbi:M24 family metallopeptidase [Actinopolyspora saharensis]|uniref:Methionyl aminopeptidase n=1 Tax=Actinopolyspora saharensis TaxID=995062 RepID=A0A1H0ZSA6_9ACTN|nr:M24 family metallopeptidase [Actinopolyspora saharensis]SDQ30239.1 methionyl aminopeptidase [Actinopolyspora saharensis]